MEWFRDVGRRELDNNTFPTLRMIIGVSQSKKRIVAPCVSVLEDGRNYSLDECGRFEEEAEEYPACDRLLNQIRIWELKKVSG